MSVRKCAQCGGSMEGKRSHAVFCSRTCKTKSSDQRRVQDGRSRTRDRARYAQEAERRREYARSYHQIRPEVSKAARAARGARKRDAVNFSFTERDWQRLVARYRGCCAYCGNPSKDLQREHVISLSRGGAHGPGNILPACPPCNYSKHTSFLMEFRLRRGGDHAHPARS